MAIYLAVDSSLSMRLPVADGKDLSRREAACKLVLKTIEKFRIVDLERTIKLIDFSHNSKVLMNDVRDVEEASKKLERGTVPVHVRRVERIAYEFTHMLGGPIMGSRTTCTSRTTCWKAGYGFTVSVSASADLISLFLLMKMENGDDRSILLVFTDACAFTPEEINLSHIPNCTIKFAIVLDESLTNKNQIARFCAISVHAAGIKEDFKPEQIVPWMPYFISDYNSINGYGSILARDLCRVPSFILKCGFLEAFFKHRRVIKFSVIPSLDDNDWNRRIEIIGFIPANTSIHMPTTASYFIAAHRGSEDILNLISAALRLEESIALCHINKNLYGALCSVSEKEEESPVYRLSMQLFPPGKKPVSWLPDLTTLLSQSTVGTGDVESFIAKKESPTKSSHSSFQRTCWYEVHGLQSDIQKISRLLKRIPERTLMFYSELNRIHTYCCAIGAEDVIDKLIQVLHEEGSTQTPIIRKHCAYACEKLRAYGLKNASEIPPLQ